MSEIQLERRPLLHVQRSERAIHVSLDRDEIDADAVIELYSFVGQLEDDQSSRALVFHLEGADRPADSVGRLAESIAYLGTNVGMTIFTRMEKVLNILERLARPTVAVVDGRIGSFGLEISLISDLTIATSRTEFHVDSIQSGFLPGMALYRLARHVGVGVAKQVALNGRLIHARRAQRYGIVDRVIQEGDDPLRSEFFEYLVNLPASTLNLARQIVNDAGPVTYLQAYEAYKAAQFHALDTVATRIESRIG